MDAIVAVYADWGIGAKGTQPLVIPADRRRFRELTMGAAVIVGRRTLEDFPGGKPLPGRENFVLSRRNITIEGAQVVHDPDVHDFYAFTRDSFRVEGYEYSEFTGKIPIAV